MSCNEPKTITGSALDANETTAVKGDKAVYVSMGGSAAVFKSYAERYAYLKGKAQCTGACLPIGLPPQN